MVDTTEIHPANNNAGNPLKISYFKMEAPRKNVGGRDRFFNVHIPAFIYIL